jgi:hypothetical protein
MQKIGIILLVCLPFLWLSCGGEPDQEENNDCAAGKPIAIFRPDLDRLTQHEFSSSGQQATEKMTFTNGTKLEIFQSGCEATAQEFRFTLSKVEAPNDEAWIKLAESQMRFLASLGPEYEPFNGWATAIAGYAPQFKLGQELEVGPGYFVKIDRIRSNDSDLVIIAMSQVLD